MFSKSNLDHYDIGRQIGKGGFSKVYLAKDRRCRRPLNIALKLIKKDDATETDRAKLKMLQRELRVHLSVSGQHPNVIELFECFEHNDMVCVAVKLARTDLRKVVIGRKKRRDIDEDSSVLDENEAKIIMYQVLSGIAFLHQRGIVHRDIKASNILLMLCPGSAQSISQTSLVSSKVPSSYGGAYQDQEIDLEMSRVVISDFGLAVQMELETDWQCCQRTLCGTTRCLAPEIASVVLMSNVQTKHRSCHGLPVDLFAAGCVFYYLLVGHYPFSLVDSDQERTILKRIVEGEWSFPSKLIISDGLRSMIIQMLSLQPKLRGFAEKIVTSSFFNNGREGMTLALPLMNNTEKGTSLEPKIRIDDYLKISETILELYADDGSEYAKVYLTGGISIFPEIDAVFSDGLVVNYNVHNGRITIKENNKIVVDVDANIDSSFDMNRGKTSIRQSHSWILSHYETAKTILRYQSYIHMVQEAALECLRIDYIKCISSNELQNKKMIVRGPNRNR